MYACMLSCLVMLNSLRLHRLQPARLLCPWYFPGKSTGAGCHFLLQGILLAQGSNLHFLHLLHWQTDSLSLFFITEPAGKPQLIYISNHKGYCSQSLLLLTTVQEQCPSLPLPLNQKGFPSGSDGKESACNAVDTGLMPGQANNACLVYILFTVSYIAILPDSSVRWLKGFFVVFFLLLLIVFFCLFQGLFFVCFGGYFFYLLVVYIRDHTTMVCWTNLACHPFL